jgi:hypothetical protein
MISPLYAFASATERDVFPEPVGPTMMSIFGFCGVVMCGHYNKKTKKLT